MNSAFKLVRSDNWLYSKIPPLLTFACLQMLVQPVPPVPALVALVALFVSAGALAAYAHVLNDIFDLDADRRAGKSRELGRLGSRKRTTLVVLLAGVGVVPWLIVPLDLWGVVLLGCIFVVPLAYAAPPIRLKERGALGILADACMAHLFPTLFVLALFAGIAGTGVPKLPFVLLAAGWALAFGLRGIIVHQIWDYTDDLNTRVQTFVTRVGTERARRFVVWVLFPLELGALFALALVSYGVAPAMLWVVLIALALDLVRFDWMGRIPFDPAPAEDGRYIALTNLYQLWLPLSLAVLLALQEPLLTVLLIAELVLFYGNLKRGSRAEVYMLATPFKRGYQKFKGRFEVWFERRAK